MITLQKAQDTGAGIAGLRNALERYSVRIKHTLEHVSDEKEVRRGLVNPFLRSIGWDPAHINRVKEERIVKDSGRADYALLDRSDQDIIIIETKSIDVEIGAERPPDQLKRYVHQLPECKVAAWTNGRQWYWFCLDHTNTLGAEPYIAYDVTEGGWLRSAVLDWLNAVRGQFDHPHPGTLLQAARRLQYCARLEAWWKENRSSPTDSLAKFLWKELGVEKSNPSKSDLEVMKSAWTDLHQVAAHPPVIPPLGNDRDFPLPDNLKAAVVPPPPENGPGLPIDRFPRAWRVRNPDTDEWEPWKIETYAIGVLISVTEWLLKWNRNPDFEPTELTWITTSVSGRDLSSRDWSPILDGKLYIHKNIKAQKKRKRLEALASKVSNEHGEPARHGQDFEVWLPPWKPRKKT